MEKMTVKELWDESDRLTEIVESEGLDVWGKPVGGLPLAEHEHLLASVLDELDERGEFE